MGELSPKTPLRGGAKFSPPAGWRPKTFERLRSDVLLDFARRDAEARQSSHQAVPGVERVNQRSVRLAKSDESAAWEDRHQHGVGSRGNSKFANPQAFPSYLAERQSPDGAAQHVLVQVEPDLWVANVIGQQGLKRVGGVPPLRYEAIREGLARVALLATEQGASVHMPRIGCELAGGKWEEVEPIITQELSARGVSVTVYAFE